MAHVDPICRNGPSMLTEEGSVGGERAGDRQQKSYLKSHLKRTPFGTTGSRLWSRRKLCTLRRRHLSHDQFPGRHVLSDLLEPGLTRFLASLPESLHGFGSSLFIDRCRLIT